MFNNESLPLSAAKKSTTTTSCVKKFTGSNSADQSPHSQTTTTMQIFREMRENNQLTDITLICSDGTRLSAHRPILAACSNYFKAIFTRPFQERQQNELHFNKIPAAIMKEILEFAYIRKANMNCDNVEELLEWADYFNIDKLVRQCCNFMVGRINVDKCLGFMKIARRYHYDDLYQQASLFTRHHFEEVAARSTEFLELESDELRELLENDYLNVSNEAAVWRAIQKWCRHDPTERYAHHIASLIKTIRIALCTHNSLELIRQDPAVENNEECRRWIGSTYKLVYGFEKHVTDEQMYSMNNHKVWSPRVPAELILAVGGWSGGSATGIIESYDQRADEWFPVPYEYPADSRAYHGCCVSGGHLYVFGGFNGHTYFNSVRSLDLHTKQWKDRAPMNSRRCYISIAEMGGQLWACGGYDGQRRLQTAERYCPTENQWSLISPMSVRRSDGHLVVINDQICMIGGFDGNDYLDTVEIYHPSANKWNRGPVMQCKRSGVGATVCRNAIYAIGGFNGHFRHKSVEMLDPRTNQWRSVREMSATKSNFGVEALGDRIYVIGGFNGHTIVPSVEIYDIRADRWESGPSLSVHRSALYCCLLSNMEYMEDFVKMPRHCPATKLNAIHQRLELIEKRKNDDS